MAKYSILRMFLCQRSPLKIDFTGVIKKVRSSNSGKLFKRIHKKNINNLHNKYMLKKITTLALMAFLATGLMAQIKTPAPSPLATASQKFGLAKVDVAYSRPAVKGRKIFGNLVPYGKVWRTGANQITTITFDKDVMVNGKKLAAGSYGWYTFPNASEWTIALNSDDKQWGAYAYDEKKDVMRFKVKAEKLPKTVENMTIAVETVSENKVNIVLSWDKTAVRFAAEHDPHEQIMADIKTATAKADCSNDDLMTAADYYLQKGLDLKQAKVWMDKVVDKDPQYWTYQLRAEIAAKLGQCEAAAQDAKQAKERAEKENDPAYVKKAEAVLAQCKGKK